MTVPILRDLAGLRRLTASWRSAGHRVAIVPTMGGLHDGHLALAAIAAKHATRVVVSIFVNPTQFSATEDLARYLRDEPGDVSKLQSAGVHAIWAPSLDAMYPPGHSTVIRPGTAGRDLEGAVRPDHFAGVATVCCKLFSQSEANIAIFGEKDYQQLCMLRQMVRDLDLPIELISGETVRETDGLARSTRNAYLSFGQRSVAPLLHQTIEAIAGQIGGCRDSITQPELERLSAEAQSSLLSGGFDAVDYVAIRDADTLSEPELADNRPLRILAAVRLGSVRLIDNVPA